MAIDPQHLLQYEAQRALADATSRALNQAGAQILSNFGKWAGRFANQVGNPNDLQQAHEVVARAMQRAVLNSYAQTVTARKAAPGLDYRQDGAGTHRRYAGGALKRALENPRMAVASPRGIEFINRGILDQEAKHWARMNFGAGDPGRGTRSVRLRLFGQYGGSAELAGDVRPAVQVPPGFWFRPGTGWVKPSAGGHRDRFYVAGANQPGRWKTATIRGRHFLEAGLDQLREQLPIQYENLMNRWLAQSLR